MRNNSILFIILIFSIGCFAQSDLIKPNILLIVSDDQGLYDVSYYGTKDIKTPNIDFIAKTGIRLDNFYANSPVCSPTRASIMTGLYPDNAGVPGVIRTNPLNSWGHLRTDLNILPAELKSLGYNSALIGKWHLGIDSPNLPNLRGFDFFHGWLGDMMDDYWSHLRHNINYMRLNERTIKAEGHATDLFTKWSVNYIESQQETDTPFFLYLAYNAPHFPVQPPIFFLDRVLERDKKIDSTRAKLVAFIEHMDKGIGDVINALEKTNQLDNTLIIFTSDNGGHNPSLANNGPYRDGKQSVYEGGLRVPTVISWKNKIKNNQIIKSNLMSVDLFPTILEIAGSKKKYNIDGLSFANELFFPNTHIDEDRIMYFVRREGGSRYGGKTINAIRKGKWKLLQNNPQGKYELFNLESDPYEENNLIDSEQKIYDQLNKLLMEQIQASGKIPWQ
ncbi:MAG: N-acetylgalactosamine 6-sulfate sulfatase [Flavobacteriales bacterium TMED235]|nr:MAG: N-acetylgalactosamine 6-sulfate sulfatase [Flavobacteriales bacterium TMED235]